MNPAPRNARQKSGHATAFAVVSLLSVSLGLTFLTAGCGGGNGSSATGAASSAASSGAGRAAIRIQWPARTNSRLIPQASNSLVVQMVRAGNVLQSQTVARPTDSSAPTSSIEFDELPIDTLSVVATAYPNADGSGVAQATGTTTLTIKADDTVGFDLAMDSTVDHLVIANATPVMVSGKTRTLSATGRVGTSDTTPVVLLSPGKLTWESSDGTVASVDSVGIVKAGVPGVVTLTVSDAESGKSGTVTVTVSVQVPDSTGPAQFNPEGASYADTTTVADGSGSWTAAGDTYAFDTTANPPTLRNTTKNTSVATGKLLGGYAVFDFPGDISITKGIVTATGTAPLVLLARGSFTLSGGASLSVAAGGVNNTGSGGGQLNGTRGNSAAQYGGGSFGGLGGGPTKGTYGDDFVGTPGHLQGGSGGYGYSTNTVGGGSIYIGAVGTLTVSGASLTANGTSISTPVSGAAYPGGGGSGGGIALFGGGGVSFSGATISASGGSGGNGRVVRTTDLIGGGFRIVGVTGVGYGGGGGRVVVGYGPGTPVPDVPDIGFINVNGGSVPSGRTGSAGVKSGVPFEGF